MEKILIQYEVIEMLRMIIKRLCVTEECLNCYSELSKLEIGMRKI